MNEPTQTTPFEAEVRAMRDRIYGPGTDKNWEGCREGWLTLDGIAWLSAQRQNQSLVTKP